MPRPPAPSGDRPIAVLECVPICPPSPPKSTTIEATERERIVSRQLAFCRLACPDRDPVKLVTLQRALLFLLLCVCGPLSWMLGFWTVGRCVLAGDRAGWARLWLGIGGAAVGLFLAGLLIEIWGWLAAGVLGSLFWAGAVWLSHCLPFGDRGPVASLQRALDRQHRRALSAKRPPLAGPRLSVGSVKLSADLETRGIALVGQNPTLRGQALADLLATLRVRRDFRGAIVDGDGELMARLYRAGDLILNPLDVRAVAWSHRSEGDDEAAIAALFEDSLEGSPAANGARSLLRALYATYDSNDAVWRAVAERLPRALAGQLAAGPAGQFWPDERTLASWQQQLRHRLGFYALLPPGPGRFGIRSWAAGGTPSWLWLPRFATQAVGLGAFYGLLLRLAIAGLQAGDRQNRTLKTAVVIDDLTAIAPVRQLLDLALCGPQAGVLTVLGLPQPGPIEAAYGPGSYAAFVQSCAVRLQSPDNPPPEVALRGTLEIAGLSAADMALKPRLLPERIPRCRAVNPQARSRWRHLTRSDDR